jgi:hypothetical protein
MRKLTVWIFAFLALCAVVGFVATGGLVGGAGSADSAAPFAAASGTTAPDTGKAVAGPTSLGASGAPEGAAGGGAGLRSTDLAGIGGIPAIGLAVVKTASLDVQVAKDDFAQAFRTALDVAAKYGGYVQSSSSSGTTVHSGSITIRVPSSSFEQAMNDLSSLGQVRSRSISGQDVTNEYVDLNARLRTWQAQEAVLLRLMRRATSIESTLRVQTNLQDVQFRIEQIKGQLRVLENQTQLATIDVAIHEPGAVVHPLQRPKPAERPSLAEAWTKAVNGFLGVLYATVVGLGYLVPIGLICLAVWFGVRRVRIGPAASS